MSFQQRITVDGNVITVKNNGFSKQFLVQSLPEEFIDWQIKERVKIFDHLLQGKNPSFLQPHLPTLITYNPEQDEFPLNAACKGVGLVPIDAELEEITNQIQMRMQQIHTQDFLSTIPHRIEAAGLFYSEPQKIHKNCLGGLEIFETQSYKNIVNHPFISLFFVSGSPTYTSYQIDCVAELIPPDHPFYGFILSMRSLFEQASFHFQQPAYPFAVKYHVIQVKNKSLKIRGT